MVESLYIFSFWSNTSWQMQSNAANSSMDISVDIRLSSLASISKSVSCPSDIVVLWFSWYTWWFGFHILPFSMCLNNCSCIDFVHQFTDYWQHGHWSERIMDHLILAFPFNRGIILPIFHLFANLDVEIDRFMMKVSGPAMSSAANFNE